MKTRMERMERIFFCAFMVAVSTFNFMLGESVSRLTTWYIDETGSINNPRVVYCEKTEVLTGRINNTTNLALGGCDEMTSMEPYWSGWETMTNEQHSIVI